ncbi:hypothetical protein EPN87_02620 [archaeon]|nr:MAG: hypothetical protein EPN87_02620 [archaeon]
MSKAVAVQMLFIIVVIGLTVFFTILVLSGWLDGEVSQFTLLSCASQKADYCYEICVRHNAQPKWDDVLHCGAEPMKAGCSNCELGATTTTGAGK